MINNVPKDGTLRETTKVVSPKGFSHNAGNDIPGIIRLSCCMKSQYLLQKGRYQQQAACLSRCFDHAHWPRIFVRLEMRLRPAKPRLGSVDGQYYDV